MTLLAASFLLSWPSLISAVAGAIGFSFLISRFRPARIDIQDLDAELDAGELLLTWSTLQESENRATSRVAELVERDLELLLIEKQGVSQAGSERRLRRISWRLLLVLLLLLAAWCLLPGHRAGDGYGFLPGVGKGLAPAAGTSPSGDAGKSDASSQSPELDEAGEMDDKSAQAGKKAERKKTAQSDKLPEQDPGHDSSANAERKAKAQREQSKRSLEPEFSKKAPRAPELAMEEWKRQKERALARGLLPAWEGKWIKDYGRALDALDKRQREKRPKEGRSP